MTETSKLVNAQKTGCCIAAIVSDQSILKLRNEREKKMKMYWQHAHYVLYS